MPLRLISKTALLLFAAIFTSPLWAVETAEVLRGKIYKTEECITLRNLTGYSQGEQNKVGLYGGWRHKATEGNRLFQGAKKIRQVVGGRSRGIPPALHRDQLGEPARRRTGHFSKQRNSKLG